MVDKRFTDEFPSTLAALDPRYATALTLRSIGARIGDIAINPVDFGALGDNTTSCTAAVQAAVDWNVTSTTATASKAAGQTVLAVAAIPPLFAALMDAGWDVYVINVSRPETINGAKAIAYSAGSLTVTLNGGVIGRGVANGDTLRFSPHSRGKIKFPPGKFKFTGPVYLDGGSSVGVHTLAAAHAMSIIVEGSGDATWLTGAFDGFFFDRGRTAYAPQSGTKVIRDFRMNSTHNTGGCARISSTVGIDIININFSAHFGFMFNSNGAGTVVLGSSAGSGYAVGSVFSPNGGTFTVQATCIVTAVGGSGDITSFAILDPGEYSAWPTSGLSDGISTNLTTTTVSGTGSGAIVTVAWKSAAQSWTAINVIGVGAGTFAGSCGICSGANGAFIGGDLSGFDRAVAAFGVGYAQMGSRVEVNGTGLACGSNENGEALSLSGISVLGGSFESNLTGIDFIVGSGNCIISGFNIAGQPSGLGTPVYGIRLRSGVALDVQCTGIVCGGNFTTAAFDIGNTASWSNLTFISCRAGNGTGAAWNLPTVANTAMFINCRDDKNGVMISPVYTFANLPTTLAAEGMEFNISDSTTATWGATAAGGGSNHVKVRRNSTVWTVMGA